MNQKRGLFSAAALAVASRFVGSSDSGPPAQVSRRAPAAANRAERRADLARARAARDDAARGEPLGRSSARRSPDKSGGAARGASARTPTDIPARGWKEIGWRVYEQIGKDRVLAVAAGVTFYWLLAIFPMIAALVSIYGFVADPSTIMGHLKAMGDVLPGGALDVIGEQVKRIASQPSGQLGFGFIAGLAVTLWSANAGMKAIFDALNVAYNEEEKRSFLMLNAQSMLFTLAMIIGAIVAMLGVVVLPVALGFLGLGETAQTLINLARWPILLVLVMFALALLYRYGPSREQPQWRWLSPGAVVAALVWLIASLAFSFYAQNFGTFNETYGSLGAVIGFMIWMWISAAIVLVGAELNAESEHQTARDTTNDPPQPMGQRGANVADRPPPEARSGTGAA
jgi:membrane protein